MERCSFKRFYDIIVLASVSTTRRRAAVFRGLPEEISDDHLYCWNDYNHD
jgi:hypothetical protein